jgi:hypothetical protein
MRIKKFDPEHKRVIGTEEVFKRIHCKVLIGKKTFRFDFVAKPGRAYNGDDIERERGRVIDYIEEKFPKLEFREVQLLPNAFNYIVIGARNESEEETTQPAEAAGDVGAVASPDQNDRGDVSGPGEGSLQSGEEAGRADGNDQGTPEGSVSGERAELFAHAAGVLGDDEPGTCNAQESGRESADGASG